MTGNFSHMLLTRFSQSGQVLSDTQCCRFDRYATELLIWNQRFNLTRITDPEEIIRRHFLDSLWALPWLPQGCLILDVGSGAGVPGIPISICRSDVRCVLLESIGKKVRFLEHVVQALDLEQTKVIQERAEVLAHQQGHASCYDRVLTRYVASLEKSAGYCLDLVKPGGLFIAYKGSDVSDEVEDAKQMLQKHGGSVLDVRRMATDRTLVFVQKE